VILDEADQLSQQAQMALRNIIVDSMNDCRFILTANYQDKVIDALKSRCTPIKLEFSNKDILKHCVSILKRENVSFSKEILKEFYEEVIVKRYPDIRSIMEHLQMMSVSGELKILKSEDAKIENEIVKYVFENLKSMDIKKIREFLISNEDKFSADYVKLAQELFDAFDDNAEVMVIIADALWRMSFQLDKEIQFIGMLINIKGALKK
jgi:replication factor C small subunit